MYVVGLQQGNHINNILRSDADILCAQCASVLNYMHVPSLRPLSCLVVDERRSIRVLNLWIDDSSRLCTASVCNKTQLPIVFSYQRCSECFNCLFVD